MTGYAISNIFLEVADSFFIAFPQHFIFVLFRFELGVHEPSSKITITKIFMFTYWKHPFPRNEPSDFPELPKAMQPFLFVLWTFLFSGVAGKSSEINGASNYSGFADSRIVEDLIDGDEDDPWQLAESEEAWTSNSTLTSSVSTEMVEVGELIGGSLERILRWILSRIDTNRSHNLPISRWKTNRNIQMVFAEFQERSWR